MYRPVDKVPDLPALEREILAFWKRDQTFAKLRRQNEGGEPWSFLDGPITANNPMGVHHAWGRSYKDMFQRYHAMNGRRLRYQNGFDCQGLWVEVEVEKELGFESKADIVTYGLDRFVRRCKERVLTYAARQTEQSVRLGYWMDWDDGDTLRRLRDALHADEQQVTVTLPTGRTVTDAPERIVGQLGSPENGGSYFTFSTENNHTIWGFLKKCHHEGFVYRGTDVMPWCTRCGTGLSQMEVAEGRKITKHTSVFVRFPLRDRADEALLVWTTTPWTLTSNVAAAVNPELTYLKVGWRDQVLYVAKGCYESDRVLDLEAAGQRQSHKLPSVRKVLGQSEVLGELKGSELVGLTYDGPFDHLDIQQRTGSAANHRVIAWDEVSEKEGTGIVHIAPGCGAEDHRVGKELGLAVVAPLDEGGRYLEGFGEWTGQHVGEVAEPIAADLKARGRLVSKEAYPHVYPHCWRCSRELVFRLVDEWFVRMDWRDRIQEVVPTIRWIPPDGEAREQDWLKNMGDWMISKKRFWGLALPIWTCKCGWFDVIGSDEELKSRAVEGWEVYEGHTPHRPWIDAVKVRCEGCGDQAHRIEDVGNPWLDAGIVPFSTVHYNTDREYWDRWYPADFVVECFPGQFRNWFYALLAMSAMLERRAPFKVLLGHGLVKDARGHEMHKSAGNSIAFDQAADVLGAEVMRYMYAAQNPVQNLNFPDLPKPGSSGGGKSTLDGEVRSRLLTWWNCYSFFVTYASADGWVPPEQPMALSDRTELDRWLLSRLDRLIGQAHTAFREQLLYRFVSDLEGFVDELSNWWLRRSRRRFWGEASDDKQAAMETLYEVLTTLCRLLAPVLPFLTEEMWQNLVVSVRPDAGSVHLAPYPKQVDGRIDEALETRVGTVIRAKELLLSLRNQAKVRARQPMATVWVRPAGPAERAVLADDALVAQVLEEGNVKQLLLLDDASDLVKTEVKADFKKLGPRLGPKMKAVAAALPTAEVLPGGGYQVVVDGEVVDIGADEVEVRRSGPPGVLVAADGGTLVLLDTNLTPELEREGVARDFNRLAQDQRKAGELLVTDRIHVKWAGSDAVAAAVAEHDAWLRNELLALSLERVEGPLGAEGKVGGESVSVEVVRA
ncbi:MAG: isoleucine--tRNA ligase [Myxococcales bacterium]|nr:isoleucine--tRNA ligase [Myxococcales bacterium]